MNESSDDEPVHGTAQSKPQEQEVVEGLRTNEPEAPFGADEPNPNVVSDKTHQEMSDEEAQPGITGYGTRDPGTEMPQTTLEHISTFPRSKDDKDDK